VEGAKETLAWIIVLLLGLIGLAIVYQMFTGKINLNKLIGEKDGKGSMSRLQLLIFTFVIAASLFLIVVSSDPPAFPSTIPPEILALLGISGGSYVLSKGIQTTKEIQQGGSDNGQSNGDQGSSPGTSASTRPEA
jgi:uncharacterized BrkB/YihY/UPF0761 family membrane protein